WSWSRCSVSRAATAGDVARRWVPCMARPIANNSVSVTLGVSCSAREPAVGGTSAFVTDSLGHESIRPRHRSAPPPDSPTVALGYRQGTFGTMTAPAGGEGWQQVNWRQACRGPHRDEGGWPNEHPCHACGLPHRRAGPRGPGRGQDRTLAAQQPTLALPLHS